MGRLAILALVVLAFGCVLGQDRDLEDHCSSFDNGLLPYCVNLDQPSSNPDCGKPYNVVTRNQHARDVFHVKNSMALRGTDSHAHLSFTTEELHTMDYFNPGYEKGAYQNSVGKNVEIPLTNGAARVDCPPTTTDMRVRLEGLSPGQKIYLAGDSEDVEGEGDWHGDLQGPYDSEAIMKALGFTTFSPGSGVVVVVEGNNVEDVYVSGAMCIFKNGKWTARVHGLKRTYTPPPGVKTKRLEEEHFHPRNTEDLNTEDLTDFLNKRSEEESKKRGEEVFMGVEEGWDKLNQFGDAGAHEEAPEGRPYTPSDDDFCLPSGGDFPCADFCSYNNPCTINSECLRDDQHPCDRRVPEYASGHISFIKPNSNGILTGYICSGGLIGQTLNYPPASSCDGAFAQTCANGLYNNVDSRTFLTSGHCLSTPESALTVEVVFNYSISCEQGITGNCYGGSDKVESSYNFACAHTTSGAELIVSSESDQFSFIQNDPTLVWLPLGDFTLLKLTGNLPSTRCYFGYSTINYEEEYGTILHRVSYPFGAPRAYADSQVSEPSAWAGGPLEFAATADQEDFFASLHVNVTDIGMSALGPQGGSSGGILYNDLCQAVGTQTGWSYFIGWIEYDSPCCFGYSGAQLGLTIDPCKPQYLGPVFWYQGVRMREVNQYIVVDGAFYSYFEYVEQDLQDLCCPPFQADPGNNIVATTKLDFSIYPDGSMVLPPTSNPVSGLLNPRYTWSDWGVEIITQKPGAGSSWQSNHPPQLFNSSNPCCGDFDLGTPNEHFGGPGDGPGGAPGPGANDQRKDWVMIISERNDVNAPDDEAGGGAIVFLFDPPVPIAFVEIIDIDFNEVDGYILATDNVGGTTQMPIIAYGDNAYYRADFYVTNIVNLTVYFPGSGAIAGIVFCDVSSPPLNAIGDYVWFDQNGNGIQDVYETTGVAGVVVQLHNSALGTGSNQRLAETVTDENGWYQFTSLGDGDYVVSFTVDDDLDFFIPYKSVYGFQGWSFSPANAGGDDSVDSDAIVTSDDNRALTQVVGLYGGVRDMTWDCGIVIEADQDLCIPVGSRGGLDGPDGFIPTGERRSTSKEGRVMGEKKTDKMSYKPKRHGKFHQP